MLGNKKQKLANLGRLITGQRQGGFTVVELMVVFVIIVTLSSIVVVGWNNTTPNRSLVIAQNEFVTQLRKVQSYAISSRNIDDNTPAKYYVLRLDKDKSTYSINAVKSTDGLYKADMETLSLPSSISVSEINLINTATGSSANTNISDAGCVWIAISAVYGKTYFLAPGTGGCSSGIDQNNLDKLSNPPVLAKSANYDVVISLKHPKKTTAKTIKIYGLSGKIEAQ